MENEEKGQKNKAKRAVFNPPLGGEFLDNLRI